MIETPLSPETTSKSSTRSATCCSHCAPDVSHSHDGDDHDGHGHEHGAAFPFARTVACVMLSLVAWLLSRTLQNVLLANVSVANVSVALYVVALFVGGWPLLRGAVRSLRKPSLDMNVLMSAAIIGAAILGDWPEAASLVVLYTLSEALEEWGLNRSRRAMTNLLQLTPTRVLRQRDGASSEVEANEIEVGEHFLVRASERIALDGIVVAGHSGVDQSPVTGESVPVEKTVGDEVFAGTLNTNRVLEIRATRLASEGTIARIAHLVDEAARQKSPRQRATETFAARYTPFVFIAAILLATIPPMFFGATWGASVTQGLALLVAACPCAFVIGGPIATICALSAAAKRGILVRQSTSLETLSQTQIVALDKTGTLTQGAPRVQHFEVFGGFEIFGGNAAELLSIAAALEGQSDHPLARAVTEYAQAQGSSTRWAQNVEEYGGNGVSGEVEGVVYRLARANNWPFSPQIEAVVRRLEEGGQSIALLGSETEVLAAFGFADELRPEAHRVLDSLRASGVRETVVLSGDNEETVRKVAQSVGATTWKSALLPHEKLRHIEELSSRGLTAMVGDGINDAPALARADVGIAVGGSAGNISTQAADFTLLNGGLSQLPFAFTLSRRTKAIIVQNLALALGLKLVFVVGLLLGIWGEWQLVGGVIADMGATLLVTANGLRLLRD
jgi:Cd2+/Zn2+-exporting ATPase